MHFRTQHRKQEGTDVSPALNAVTQTSSSCSHCASCDKHSAPYVTNATLLSQMLHYSLKLTCKKYLAIRRAQVSTSQVDCVRPWHFLSHQHSILHCVFVLAVCWHHLPD